MQGTLKVVKACTLVQQKGAIRKKKLASWPLTYMNHCVDLIFKHNIFLNICKGAGGKDTEEGDRNRKIIDDMYDDFWLHKLDIKDVLP